MEGFYHQLLAHRQRVHNLRYLFAPALLQQLRDARNALDDWLGLDCSLFHLRDL